MFRRANRADEQTIFLRSLRVAGAAALCVAIVFPPATPACGADEQPPHASSKAKPTPREGIAGSWHGTLDVGVRLPIVFNIEKSAEGTLSATLDSPDQGTKGIAVSEITFANGKLLIVAKSIDGSFTGKIANDYREIVGTWTQVGRATPLVLLPIDKVAEPKRPQVPAKPYPYDEEEVVYENRQAGVKLAGTLTLPRTNSPCAAVLLITGSGAQDRDESLLGHKPFLVLADDLTRRGIAVLRVDDRGVGGSTGSLPNSTIEDLAGDAFVGVEFLKSRKEIDPRRIGLVGHSEGGLIAPAAAARSGDIAFIVLIAGPGVTGEEILYAQGGLIMRAAGASHEAVAKQRKLQEDMFAVVKNFDRQAAVKPTEGARDDSATTKKLAELIAGASAELPDDQREAAGKLGVAQSRELLTPSFRYFLTYDPRPALAKVRCRVLAVIGERDLQVPPGLNLPEIEKALKSGGNAEYTLREFPGLNHLLQHSKTGSPSEYGQIEETIAPEALAFIGQWIVQQTGK